MLRAAVLGCGTIGTGAGPQPGAGVVTHAGAYGACADTELVAVCDADPARAAAAAQHWGTRATYGNAAALLAREQPALVSVCTPDATHAELVALALRTPGVAAVLAEKPLALDAHTARALTALAAERRVALAVNYSRRFAPAFQALRARIAAGELGDLQHVSGVYVKGLVHNGTHWLDLLRLLAGEPVVVAGWDRLREGGEDPSLDAELALPGGATARMAALDTRSYTAFEMELWGTRGRVRIAESGHVLEQAGVGDDPRHPGYRVLRPPDAEDSDALRDVLLHAVGDVVRCVRGGGAPACAGADGAAALALAEAIRTAAA